MKNAGEARAAHLIWEGEKAFQQRMQEKKENFNYSTSIKQW